ncbi:MAG: DUF3298 and DUF4163 domain-containing protein [Ignavibacteria bacterium]|jgi:hypothetical protein
MRYRLLPVFAVTVFLLFSCEKESKQDSTGKIQSLSYESKEYYNHQGECDSLMNDCVYVKLVYPEFMPLHNPAADSINKFVKYVLLVSYEMEMYESFDAIAQSLFDDYNSVKADYEDYNGTWSLEKTIEVKSQTGNLITLYYSEYSYMGGAHPNSVFDYFNFDLTTGKRIFFDDLVQADKKEELLKLGEKKFRELKGIPVRQDLETAGYWFENNEFYLAQSFFMNDSGVVFLYNAYEIAPYAEGITELFISKDELKGILK